MGLHARGRSSMVVGAAAGLLQHGRGAARHEIPWLRWHEAQSVPRTEHGESALSAVQVHGHRRAERNMTMFDTCGPTDTPDDVDIDAMREKYAQERAKRLRPEGASQYLELKNE